MTQILDGKVALVTGAGGGIGRAIVIAMARAGASVVINDIGVSLSGEGGSASPAEEVKAEIEAFGGKAVINTDSVSEWDAAQRMVAQARDSFGRLDIVVNNAGILRDAMFHKMTPEQWLAVIGVHLNGSFFVSRAAAEIFREQESGSFIHMVSTSGLIGNLGQANYSAAKLGMVGLSKTIALDMKRYNVRSNCIAPFAWGRMTSNIPTETPDQIARVENLKKMTPEKNAPLAVFLGSDDAGDVTGQIFSVRRNEIFLLSQNRPIRSVHRDGDWTAETVRDHAIPALRSSFYPLERSQDVFTWDPC
ncbi:SDR family oxidoreductase (plasmid) [Paracoccus versutus]|uniref:NAD(P)-dependent dehydrogenase (Short-subunit alcohol dehydrogenase family) n=1 Tax=Paracoccus versutus TaxID=34007 RepID=A0A3D9XUS1_PARVE|nr:MULTISPECIES: SDR family NAD(P)-dependent oxidoreductase [Paracoccus]KGJ04905.1 3-hydroxyacyl-CoA dehydrogenase [Paracoccus versutus]MBT0781893.1 SDR family oxidoreductase [Paracoccus sp. pheM1]REF71962.1 NAD(P)-dependent dehydrogenase (short-subunit alcohol dehydrogenase family) [Paracoccus versutus]REG30108.1 NAD(P)-dependent dehydrogenase (short-subunit alcohol dehydrogenase family) [Paracoccus versutus]WEJ82266.1 SDR family oxidoreductase [Paracoccus versutus]